MTDQLSEEKTSAPCTAPPHSPVQSTTTWPPYITQHAPWSHSCMSVMSTSSLNYNMANIYYPACTFESIMHVSYVDVHQLTQLQHGHHMLPSMHLGVTHACQSCPPAHSTTIWPPYITQHAPWSHSCMSVMSTSSLNYNMAMTYYPACTFESIMHVSYVDVHQLTQLQHGHHMLPSMHLGVTHACQSCPPAHSTTIRPPYITQHAPWSHSCMSVMSTSSLNYNTATIYYPACTLESLMHVSHVHQHTQLQYGHHILPSMHLGVTHACQSCPPAHSTTTWPPYITQHAPWSHSCMSVMSTSSLNYNMAMTYYPACTFESLMHVYHGHQLTQVHDHHILPSMHLGVTHSYQ